MFPTRQLASAGSAAAIFAATMLAATPASAVQGDTPVTAASDVVIDWSYDPSSPIVMLDADGQPRGRAFCPDKAFTAVPTMTTSVPGCNIMGTSTSLKVTYKWYKHRGNGTPCIWGKGFNSKSAPVWNEVGCGSGRSKAVPWGKVLASKTVKGLAVSGWAGVQWS